MTALIYLSLCSPKLFCIGVLVEGNLYFYAPGVELRPLTTIPSDSLGPNPIPAPLPFAPPKVPVER
jgi:hypothetical protein